MYLRVCVFGGLCRQVEHNPDFIGLEVQKDPYSDGSLVDEVLNLMLQVQAHDPHNADVQEVLGVLYVLVLVKWY